MTSSLQRWFKQLIPRYTTPWLAMASVQGGVKKIYVLDCGGQYAHLIASRVRKHEALSVIVEADTPVEELTGAHLPSRSRPAPAPRVTRPAAQTPAR